MIPEGRPPTPPEDEALRRATKGELELRPEVLEDHELEIVSGGLAGFIPRPSSPTISTNPNFSFIPGDPC